MDTEGYPITFNSDNTATLDEGCDKYDVKISEVSLVGESWGNVISGGYSSENKLSATLAQKTFSSSATGYLVAFKQAQDEYNLYSYTCDDSGINCNFIRKPGTNDAATAFSDIFVLESDAVNGATVQLNNDSGMMTMIAVLEGETATAGKAKIIQMGMVKAEIDWEIKTIKTVEIMSFSNVPAEFSNKYSTPFVTLQDGKLRVGDFSQAESGFGADDTELMLNKSALDQILNDSDLQMELTSYLGDSSSSDGSSSSDSSSSDGSSSSDSSGMALTDALFAKQAFVNYDSSIAFYADKTGEMAYREDDGTAGGEDFTWSIMDSQLKITYLSDGSFDMVTVSAGSESDAYDITIVPSEGDTETDTIYQLKPVALGDTKGMTLSFNTDANGCTATPNYSNITFDSTGETAVYSEACGELSTSVNLTITKDPSLDSVLVFTGATSGPLDVVGSPIIMKVGLKSGDLSAGVLSFVYLDSDIVVELEMKAFTGTCTAPTMWNEAMGHCM